MRLHKLLIYYLRICFRSPFLNLQFVIMSVINSLFFCERETREGRKTFVNLKSLLEAEEIYS